DVEAPAERERAREVGAAREAHHEDLVERTTASLLELAFRGHPAVDELVFGALPPRRLGPHVSLRRQRRARIDRFEADALRELLHAAHVVPLPGLVASGGAAEEDDERALRRVRSVAVEIAGVARERVDLRRASRL